MRKPIIAGNWKMHMLQGEAQELLNGLCDLGKASGIAKDKLPEVVVAPVFTSAIFIPPYKKRAFISS